MKFMLPLVLKYRGLQGKYMPFEHTAASNQSKCFCVICSRTLSVCAVVILKFFGLPSRCISVTLVNSVYNNLIRFCHETAKKLKVHCDGNYILKSAVVFITTGCPMSSTEVSKL